MQTAGISSTHKAKMFVSQSAGISDKDDIYKMIYPNDMYPR